MIKLEAPGRPPPVPWACLRRPPAQCGWYKHERLWSGATSEGCWRANRLRAAGPSFYHDHPFPPWFRLALLPSPLAPAFLTCQTLAIVHRACMLLP